MPGTVIAQSLQNKYPELFIKKPSIVKKLLRFTATVGNHFFLKKNQKSLLHFLESAGTLGILIFY